MEKKMKYMQLLLCLMLELQYRHVVAKYKCNFIEPGPNSCQNNPIVTVFKNEDNYWIWLRVCYNNQCLQINGFNWIRCDDVCEQCERLMGSNKGCETNDPMQCEQNVDMFLDKYCASATLSMSTADSIGTVTSTLSIVKSVTVTANAGDTSNLDKEAKRSPPAPVALGILLGLMVMILAAVTIGWIWTCQRAKKSKKAQSSSKISAVDTSTDENNNYGERFLENPTYGETTTTTQQQTTGSNGLQSQFDGMYDTVQAEPADQEPEYETGQAYDVLNREQENGREAERQPVASFYPQTDKNYSKLSTTK